jgi:predicted transposase/invertase (TIGR01784 family)
MEKGIEKGLVKGRAEGRLEERHEIARTMKQLSLPVEQIMKITHLTAEEIAKL